eukprot:gene10098-18751_t
MGRFRRKCSNPLHQQWCCHKCTVNEADLRVFKVPTYAKLQAFKLIAKANGHSETKIKHVCVFCIENCEKKREFTKYLHQETAQFKQILKKKETPNYEKESSDIENDSEITETLSNPSQKLMLSSQETDTQETNTQETYNDFETLEKNDNFEQQEIGNARINLKSQVSKIKEKCFQMFRENGESITDPAQFKKLCNDAGATTIFETIVEAMSTARQTAERKKLIEKRAVSIIYSLVYGQSQRANWFQVATARTLRGFGVTSKGMETLHNMGFTAHPRTVINTNEGIAANHSKTVNDFFKNAAEKGHMVVIFIDDYHNIHANPRATTSATSQVTHMATILLKSFPSVEAISHATFPVNDIKPANFENLKSVLDNNIDFLSKSYVGVMPDWMKAQFFDPEVRRKEATPFDY